MYPHLCPPFPCKLCPVSKGSIDSIRCYYINPCTLGVTGYLMPVWCLSSCICEFSQINCVCLLICVYVCDTWSETLNPDLWLLHREPIQHWDTHTHTHTHTHTPMEAIDLALGFSHPTQTHTHSNNTNLAKIIKWNEYGTNTHTCSSQVDTYYMH